MPNVFDANGLQVSTYSELLTKLTDDYKAIYGSDIDLSSNTPDGQMMNIYIMSTQDIQDLLVQINNGFDPDYAVGRILDQRVAINGIQRQGGTYTVTPVTLVLTQSENLYGLDQSLQEPYTVQDNAGTRWILMTTELGLAAGTHILNFRAENPGQVLTVPNTITTPVTIALGVSSINNPTTYTTLGVNEESDAQLRVRRQRSVSIASQGYVQSLRAMLRNIPGVSFAEVYENITGSVDADGIPSHSIWVIVSGSGAASAIANAIYTKRGMGAGMKGDTTYTVTQEDGTPFIVQWDNVIPQNTFVKFSVTSINGIVPPNIANIRSGLVTSYVPGINDELDINGLACAVQNIDPNALVTNAGFSNGQLQSFIMDGVALDGGFKVKYGGVESANIVWIYDAATIQAIIRAIPGLSNAVVTGSVSDGVVSIAVNESSVPYLIYVSENTLATSFSGDPVGITPDYHFQYVLTAAKQYQPVIAEAGIIITPMQLTKSVPQIGVGGVVQFNGLGGYGAYLYSIQINNSGGSINSSTGEYTAGATPNVTDTVKVVDVLGNTATIQITVV